MPNGAVSEANRASGGKPQITFIACFGDSLFGCMLGPTQPEENVMAKHLFDHRRASKAGRIVNFLAIARVPRSTWHRSEAKAGSARIVQFCRIARGRLV